MSGVTLSLIAIILVVVMYLYSAYHWKRRHLYTFAASLSGPSGTLPFIGDGLVFGTHTAGFVGNLLAVFHQFQSGFRFWLGPVLHYCITSPKHLELFLLDPRIQQKGVIYEFQKITFGNGLVMLSGEKWRTHRRIINKTLSKSILDEYVNVFSAHSTMLVNKMKQEVNGSKFNLTPYLHRCTFDIVCETLMGVQVDSQNDASRDFLHHITRMLKCSGIRISKPWLYPDVIFYNSKYGKQHSQSRNLVCRFINQVINEKNHAYLSNNRNATGTSTLEQLLATSEETDKIKPDDLHHEMLTILMASFDPIETMSSIILLMLAIKQDIQDRVYEEIVDIFGGSSRSVTASDLPKMKYLKMVIQETLRLFGLTILSRQIQEDVIIEDHLLPAGTNILYSPFVTHRLQEYWGPTPEVFNPDHFLPEHVANRPSYAYMPFSVGPRACAGQVYGMFALKVTVVEVLRKYIVFTDQKESDIKIVGALGTRPLGGTYVQIKEREQ